MAGMGVRIRLIHGNQCGLAWASDARLGAPGGRESVFDGYRFQDCHGAAVAWTVRVNDSDDPPYHAWTLSRRFPPGRKRVTSEKRLPCSAKGAHSRYACAGVADFQLSIRHRPNIMVVFTPSGLVAGIAYIPVVDRAAARVRRSLRLRHDVHPSLRIPRRAMFNWRHPRKTESANALIPRSVGYALSAHPRAPFHVPCVARAPGRRIARLPAAPADASFV